MTEEMFPIATHDADRERIRARARLARDVLADLEEAAISAASRHGHQVDALKTELAVVADERDSAIAELDRLNHLDVLSLQLPSGGVPAGIEQGLRCWHSAAFAARTAAWTLKERLDVAAVDSMAVGLDDIRTILEEEKHDVVQHLLVIEDDKVQVVDSIHQLLAHIIAVDTAWPASLREATASQAELRRSLLWTQDELEKANAAALANAEAEADHLADMDGDLRQAVTELIDSIRPIDVAAARLADNGNPTSAIIVVAEAMREFTGQILENNEAMRALALARADADRLETELHAIEAACEAAGMAATVEREDIPAWLALHLTPRAAKVKAKRKAKAPAVEDEAGGIADAGGADE